MSKMMGCFGWAFLVAICGFGGCSDSLGAKVSGVVTLDDKPLTTGHVAFVPKAGSGTIGNGQIDGSGNYVIQTGTSAGLAPGAYTATVVATEPIPESGGNVEVVPKLLTPAKYSSDSTSDLHVEVKPGNNDIPLKLKSSP